MKISKLLLEIKSLGSPLHQLPQNKLPLMLKEVESQMKTTHSKTEQMEIEIKGKNIEITTISLYVLMTKTLNFNSQSKILLSQIQYNI